MKERLREQWTKCEEAVVKCAGTFLEEHAKLVVIIEEAEQAGYTLEQICQMCLGEKEVAMKSALVIDTPEKCINCKFLDEDNACILADTSSVENINSKPEWCPLVELPEMDGLKAAATANGCLHPVEYARGWNDFRNKLEK